MDQNEFVKGALIGGCIGSVLAMFLAPKSGSELRQSIVDTYHTMGDQAAEYVDEVKNRAHHLIGRVHNEEPENPHAFLYGTASGAIIGAVAALLLAPQSGEKLRSLLGDQYEEVYDKAQHVMQDAHKKGKAIESSLEDWKDTFTTLIQKLTNLPAKKKTGQSFIDEIVDWASLGLRFYNQMHTRR